MDRVHISEGYILHLDHPDEPAYIIIDELGWTYDKFYNGKRQA